MATITVGSKTLTIPVERVEECAAIIKKWCSLEGDTPQEILDNWSANMVEEVKRVLIDRIGEAAYSGSMQSSEEGANVAKETAQTQAENILVLG